MLSHEHACKKLDTNHVLAVQRVATKREQAVKNLGHERVQPREYVQHRIGAQVVVYGNNRHPIGNNDSAQVD